jgi:ubiquinone/menaquinone biosynthesis C-methylase UbiE
MPLETYYRDRWLEIGPERLDRYEAMFQWSPAMDPLSAQAEIEPGQTIADFGCGPGFLAIELAKRVGPNGHVHALDINAEFIARARARVMAEGLGEQITLHHLTNGDLPFADGSLDRLVAKSVIVFVDDPLATFKEFHRVLKPGGKAHAVERDLGISFMSPVPVKNWNALLDAAGYAYRNPLIGRQMYGLAKRAGFSLATVQVISTPDTEGRSLNDIKSLVDHARRGGKIDEELIEAVLDIATRAVDDGTFLGLIPRFVVTATV